MVFAPLLLAAGHMPRQKNLGQSLHRHYCLTCASHQVACSSAVVTQVFSKLQSGRMPSIDELMRALAAAQGHRPGP